MAGKVTAEGNPIVVSSGSSSKTTVGSPTGDGVRDVRDDRSWKAYVSQMDSTLANSLLVNGEDLSMASNLGFLYDYYEVTEESNPAPPSPSNQGYVFFTAMFGISCITHPSVRDRSELFILSLFLYPMWLIKPGEPKGGSMNVSLYACFIVKLI